MPATTGACLLGRRGRVARRLVLSLVRSAAATPAALETAFQLLPLLRAHAFPALLAFSPMPMSTTSETAEENLAQQQDAQRLQEIDLRRPDKQGRHQPVPEQHD